MVYLGSSIIFIIILLTLYQILNNKDKDKVKNTITIYFNADYFFFHPGNNYIH